MKLAGNDMLIQSLVDEGVEFLFGYPGGAALHIYDAIFNQNKLQHILVRHEQGATHAADGYARATGKPGVVLVTSGPGATNAITGIATAFMDSIPMVVLSGQVASHLIGTDAFQETDMIGISRPIVKHSFSIESAEEIPRVIKEAFYIATSGRPGPVVIDIPKDTILGVSHVIMDDEIHRTPLGGFINHSDKPNCIKYLEGNKYYIKTTKKIRLGNELFLKYSFYEVR